MELEHNEKVIYHIKEMQNELRYDVYTAKVSVKRLNCSLKRFKEQSLANSHKIEYVEEFTNNLTLLINKFKEFFTYLIQASDERTGK